jgi:hypothetical protein
MWHVYFWSFWWLIFPFMGFLFGAFGMWMGYRAHRDRMELMKTYAAQGKDPAEVAKIMGGPQDYPGGPYGPYGGGGPWGWGYGRWGYGRWGYWGPMREWRRVIVFTCLAVGFGVASQYGDIPGTEHAFTIVAVIMGVLALGSFLFAIVATIMASRWAADSRSQNGQSKNGG